MSTFIYLLLLLVLNLLYRNQKISIILYISKVGGDRGMYIYMRGVYIYGSGINIYIYYMG